MKPNLKSVVCGATLAVFALLAVASGGKKEKETAGDGGGTTASTASIGTAATGTGAAAAATTFETIEVARPSSEDIKVKVDVPSGTQTKTAGSRVILTKGDRYTVEVAANKDTIEDVKKTMTGGDSGWRDVKILKETPNVIVFKGDFLGQTRTRIHSSASIKGFWLTCGNPVSAMVSTAAIDDMIRTCESMSANAPAAPAANAASSAKPVATAKAAAAKTPAKK